MSKEKVELIAETKDAAVAFYEDFRHLQLIAQERDTSAAALRRSAAILRRWLVDGALQRVSAPRVGRINIQTIDNNPIYRVTRQGKVVNFVSGGANVHGVYLAALTSAQGNNASPEDFHPDSRIAVSINTFIKQKVIFTEGEWRTRLEVIKYVANVDSGVHAGQPKQPFEETLGRFRVQASVTLEDGAPDGGKMPTIALGIGLPASDSDLLRYDPTRINGVLLEILATVSFLLASPDVQTLVSFIEKEIGA